MNDENYLYIKAELQCGTQVEAVQPHRGMNLKFTFTPKPGVPVADFADLKNGVLNVRVTEESLVGLYQLLRLMVDPIKKPKQKNFWQELLDQI